MFFIIYSFILNKNTNKLEHLHVNLLIFKILEKKLNLI